VSGALATFIGSCWRRRWSLSFTAGGETYPEAQNAALVRCNADERSRAAANPAPPSAPTADRAFRDGLGT
jgi:hypothetical protein